MPAHQPARKTAKRVHLVETLASAVSEPAPGRKLGVAYARESELTIEVARQLQRALLGLLAELHPELDEAGLVDKARSALLGRGGSGSVSQAVRFFGQEHRPDLVIELEGIRIAVEVQGVDRGVKLRAGLGKVMVYAQRFDFVIAFLVDTSSSHGLLGSVYEPLERGFLEMLWEQHNVRMRIL